MRYYLLRLDVDYLQTLCECIIMGVFILLCFRTDGAITRLFSMLPVFACLASSAMPAFRRFLYRNIQLLQDEHLLVRVNAWLIEGHERHIMPFPGYLSVTNLRLIFKSRKSERVLPHSSILSVEYRSRFLGIERWISIVTLEEKLTFGVNYPEALATEVKRAIEKEKTAMIESGEEEKGGGTE